MTVRGRTEGSHVEGRRQGRRRGDEETRRGAELQGGLSAESSFAETRCKGRKCADRWQARHTHRKAHDLERGFRGCGCECVCMCVCVCGRGGSMCVCVCANDARFVGHGEIQAGWTSRLGIAALL